MDENLHRMSKVTCKYSYHISTESVPVAPLISSKLDDDDDDDLGFKGARTTMVIGAHNTKGISRHVVKAKNNFKRNLIVQLT